MDDDSKSSQDYRGEIYALRALSARYGGHSQQAVVLCRQALAQLPTENAFARAFILTALGGALRVEGKTQEAISVYVDSIQTCAKSGHILALMGAIYQLHELYVECGRLRNAEQLLQQSLETYRQYADLPAAGLLYTGLGALAYERNELDQAATQLQMALSLSQSDRIRLMGQLLLAQVQLTREDSEAAEPLLRQVEDTIQSWPQNEVSTHLRGFMARMALWQGDLTVARSWRQTFEAPSSEQLTYSDEFQSLILARLLIAEGRLNSSASFFGDASILLARIEKTAVSAGRFCRAMEAQLLQALAYNAMDDTTKATQFLEQALSLAEAEGFVRTFVNEGPSMARLLYEALAQGIAPDYVRQLLAAFPVSEPEQTPPPKSRNSEFEWIEPLSERETDVLQLLAKGLPRKEIASTLFLSPHTVKSHIRNIYSKLDVHNQMQAVAKARGLGILDSD